ncbi:MAG: hypothetical protein U9R36_02940 [Elusimicrobiota bacterium]|nr:hypothetical protein [Elusimicrobiota bacterium]
MAIDTKTAYTHPSFMKPRYTFRRKVFKLFGGAFHVYDDLNNLAFYSKQKAFKLKEDFRIYSDENCMEELLTIKTPQVLDISATYNVVDPKSGPVGSVKRKGLKSIFKDEWIFISPEGTELGKMSEASVTGALFSRFINLILQKYSVMSSGGTELARLRQHFNPFILKYTMDIMPASSEIDRRLLVAAGILLSAIERRQK